MKIHLVVIYRKAVLFLLFTFTGAYQLSLPTPKPSDTFTLIGSHQTSFDDDFSLLEQSTVTGSYCFSNSTSTRYRCAGTKTCTSNYQFCEYINESICADPSKPFRCFSDKSQCASNMITECCTGGQFFCPHTRTCVKTSAECCSLNVETPIFCVSSNKCVAHAYQCCSNYQSSGKAMVRCTHELKCVPENTSAFCFNPITRTCDEAEFPFFCSLDGTCKRQNSECLIAVVCPPGYFQCPDKSCVAGADQFAKCVSLKTCNKNLASDSTVPIQYIRCNDGKTCSTSFESCPTYKLCNDGVICPDMSCKKTAYECVEPPLYLGYDKQTSCGPYMLKCPNGVCASSCESQHTQRDCNALKKVFCSRSNRCANDYMQCEEPTHCPLISNYTYASDTFLCGIGPQICVTDLNDCKSSSLTSRVSLYDVTRGTNVLALPTFTSSMYTCSDGRVFENADYCSTPFACSNSYVKCGGFGQFCLTKQTIAKQTGETFIKHAQNKCRSGMVSCISGQCLSNIYDCPQQVTCPTAFPFQCQDGACVDAVSKCAQADAKIQDNLQVCLSKNLLLCQSDLKTCVQTLQSCPTVSSCPKGYIKCSETNCVDPKTSSCPPLLGNPCTTSDPYFCRFSQSCAISYEKCAAQTACPFEAPVMCATDKSCKKTIYLCPTPGSLIKSISNVIKTNIMTNTRTKIQDKPLLSAVYDCTSTQFYCKYGCSNTPCPEWLKCAKDTQIKCWNGMCVDSETQCPDQITGCPFYLPIRCPYSAKCVKAQAECGDETQSKQQLTSACSIFSTAKVGCKLEGNCKSSIEQCVQSFQPTCATYLYPNTIKGSNASLDKGFCYIPSCPSQYPVKCRNGLCVTEDRYCPASSASIYELLNCFEISLLNGMNLQFPCGDGSCVRTPDQCPPLYDCALNPTEKVRCADGSCKSKQSECAQLYASCPSSLSYRCSTGQCVQKKEFCLLNDFGCPINLPFRCIYTGVCMADSYFCYETYSMIDYLSLAPPVNKTNLCQRLDKVPCYSKNDLFYCADSASQCYSPINGCPVNRPILCSNNKCVSNIANCSTGKSSVALTESNKSLCPAATPFRCSLLDKTSCAKLPHSSYLSLKDQTCSQGIQYLEKLYVMNNCARGATPFSCGDGSCVADPAECKSCPYFCGKLMLCVGSQIDCDLHKSNLAQSEMDHLCSSGTPYLCILDGQCVQDPINCPSQKSGIVDKGLLYDDSCPSQTPIRCISGLCVSSYQSCLSNQDLESPAFISPMPWEFNPILTANLDKTCQVVCSDGSCRDRQENCPVIKACSNPLKPFRCMSGFCAQDKTACIFLYGEQIETENPSKPSVVCQTETKSTKLLFRCEDGTCRSGYLDVASNEYKTQCLSYLGCSLSSPYQCPAGQCVQTQKDCFQFSKACEENQYQCANHSCVSSPYECPASAAYFETVQMRYDLDVLSSHTINFAFVDAVPVARMKLPSSSMKLSEESIVRRKGIQRITFSPVPQTMTDSTVNLVDPSFYRYLKKKVNISKEGIINPQDSVLSPTVFIWNHNSTNQELFEDATLEFKLDGTTWPSLLKKATDICLAYAKDGAWVCQSRTFLETTDGFLSFPIKSLNQRYAVIVNPSVNGGFRLWLSDNKWWIILGVLTFAVLILIAILVLLLTVCFIKKRSKLQDSTAYIYQKPQEQRSSARAKKEANFDEEPFVNSQGRVETIDSVMPQNKTQQVEKKNETVKVTQSREYSVNASYHSKNNRDYIVEDYSQSETRKKSPPKDFASSYQAQSQPTRSSKRPQVSQTSATYDSVGSNQMTNKPSSDSRGGKQIWNKHRDLSDSDVSKQPQSLSSQKAHPQNKSQLVHTESSPEIKRKQKREKEPNLNEQWYYLTNEYFQTPEYSFIQDFSPPKLANNEKYASMSSSTQPRRNPIKSSAEEIPTQSRAKGQKQKERKQY